MFAQKSILKLEFERLGKKSVIKDAFFTPPFKITRPFYKENLTQIYVLNSSAGVFANDDYKWEIRLLKDSNIELLSQSYEKIYDTKNLQAKKVFKAYLEENSKLIYNLKPLHLQENSSFSQQNEIYLEKNAKLIFVDTNIFARNARNEKFAFKKFENFTQIYRENELIFSDKFQIIPNQNDILYFENFTHYLNILLFGYDEFYDEILAKFYNATPLFYEGICLKFLDDKSENLLKISEDLISFLN